MRLRIIPDIVNDQKLCVLSKQNTAREAAKQMAENDIAAIVVTGDGGKLLGIVTERDPVPYTHLTLPTIYSV